LNSEFLKIIAATPADRRDLFLATANRIGTPIQNVEKDFWVVFVLDLLFNGRAKDEPRLLFEVILPMRPLGILPNVDFISAIHAEIIRRFYRKTHHSPH
jgi:hypothetical protein